MSTTTRDLEDTISLTTIGVQVSIFGLAMDLTTLVIVGMLITTVEAMRTLFNWIETEGSTTEGSTTESSTDEDRSAVSFHRRKFLVMCGQKFQRGSDFVELRPPFDAPCIGTPVDKSTLV